MREQLDKACIDSDIVITSGGVSMGDFDIVRNIMESDGEIIFWRIKIKPGSPPLFGKWKDKPLFGLPGNPVSTHVVFLALAVPWISHPKLFYKKIRVRLNNDIKGAPSKTTFRRIKIHSGDELTASTHTHQGSGNINSMVVHDALSVLPPDTNGKCGDIIDALWLSD